MTDHLFTWPPLTRGVLLRRYKRFMADVVLDDGTAVTAHCPNSGRMLSCSESGRPVFLSRTDRPGRKFPFTWEMIEMPGSPVVVNTLRANQIASSAIRRGLIPELSGYAAVRPEVATGNRSRIDLLLTGEGRAPCLVEVKSSTLAERETAMFPDAVTQRGLRHVRELAAMCRKGYRGVTIFIIQRMDARVFSPADHIDPAYAAGLRKACSEGMEVLAYDTLIDTSGVALGRNIPCML